jgi:hypothetical protein
MSSALVKHQPPSFDRLIQTGLVLVRRAFLAVQEWPVDQLDPAVLHGLDAAGDLKDLAGGLFGIGKGRSVAYFIALCPARFSRGTWRLLRRGCCPSVHD